MDLDLDENQRLVSEAFGDFFAKEVTTARVRAAEPLGFDETLWSQVVAMGASTMGVAEKLGGGAATTIELALVAELVGRYLAPVPFVEAVVASNALAAAGADDLVLAAVNGAVATVALRAAHGGVCRLVPAGAVAAVVVVLDGDDLVALCRPGGSSGPHLDAPPNLGSSPLADVSISDGAFQRVLLATGDDAHRLHREAVSEWKLLTAAALEGIRGAALSLAVEYVKQRHAFGVPIGWFQAVQHRLADLAVAGDGARLLVFEAAWARQIASGEADERASMAFLCETDLAFRTARESLQFHGGYGYTLEYDIQLYFRRAKSWPLALGDPRREYQRLARHLYPTD